MPESPALLRMEGARKAGPRLRPVAHLLDKKAGGSHHRYSRTDPAFPTR